MIQRDIVVIGASAGGIEALSSLIGQLPEKFPAAVFIVQHIESTSPGVLPDIVSRFSALRVKHAEDGEKFKRGVVYVAPPDHHLLLRNGTISVARGPKENLHRPSVDALFRSAAYAYGERVIAVVLTGNLDDGSAGMWAVKACGGVGIAQDPNDAVYPEMPRNAIEYTSLDYVEPLAGIGARITELVNGKGEPVAAGEPVAEGPEVRPYESELSGKPDVSEFGTPSAFTCPSCSGTLWEFKEGDLVRYRCRTGHAFSLQSMLAEMAEAEERAMWVAIRTLDERGDLMERLAERANERGNEEAGKRFEKRHEEAEDNARILRNMLKALRDTNSSDAD